MPYKSSSDDSLIRSLSSLLDFRNDLNHYNCNCSTSALFCFRCANTLNSGFFFFISRRSWLHLFDLCMQIKSTSKYSKCPKRVSSFFQNTFTKPVKPVIYWLDHDISSSLLADSLSIVLFPIYLQYHPDRWADPSHYRTIHFSPQHHHKTLRPCLHGVEDPGLVG